VASGLCLNDPTCSIGHLLTTATHSSASAANPITARALHVYATQGGHQQSVSGRPPRPEGPWDAVCPLLDQGARCLCLTEVASVETGEGLRSTPSRYLPYIAKLTNNPSYDRYLELGVVCRDISTRCSGLWEGS